MKKIIRYNPSLTTMNMGDFVIFDSIEKQLGPLFKDAFNVDVSTHLPISYIFSNLLKEADYKFVCGTNLLMGKLNGIFRQWDINLFNAAKLGPAILIGAGWWQYNNNPNGYTKKVYKKILSREFNHSVRDNYTKQMLNSMGFDNVICTACPTMWSLTKDHCEGIPQTKASRVVTTLTDYNKDIEKDQRMLDILSENYDKVYVWIQGTGDYAYLGELRTNDKIEIIPPSLTRYDEVLENEDVDYMGTRLHGGIRALQKQVRCVILGVDNRAKEKEKDFRIKVIDRNEVEKLSELINSSFKTEIEIPIDEINRWKSQFI